MLGGFLVPAIGKAGPPAPRYFAAGYSYRRRRLIPANIHRLTAADGSFVLPLALTADWLKSAANGGKVQSSAGNDIRIERPGGVKLPHDLAVYQPATGKAGFWIRFPAAASAAAIEVHVYYGKASAAAEADKAATWAGCTLSMDPATGLDAGPNAAHLTLTGVVATTLQGLTAGDFGA